jgi:ABC-2 type transport system permease protein
VASTALFYGTPVLYPLDIVPNNLVQILFINPLTPLFEQARKWIIDPDAPGAATAAGGWEYLIAPIAIYIVVCVLAVWVFDREAPRVAEEL